VRRRGQGGHEGSWRVLHGVGATWTEGRGGRGCGEGDQQCSGRTGLRGPVWPW
ncbi:hypothetical protein KI387_017006, partial [Taxus chinensis]